MREKEDSLYSGRDLQGRRTLIVERFENADLHSVSGDMAMGQKGFG